MTAAGSKVHPFFSQSTKRKTTSDGASADASSKEASRSSMQKASGGAAPKAMSCSKLSQEKPLPSSLSSSSSSSSEDATQHVNKILKSFPSAFSVMKSAVHSSFLQGSDPAPLTDFFSYPNARSQSSTPFKRHGRVSLACESDFTADSSSVKDSQLLSAMPFVLSRTPSNCVLPEVMSRARVFVDSVFHRERILTKLSELNLKPCKNGDVVALCFAKAFLEMGSSTLWSHLIPQDVELMCLPADVRNSIVQTIDDNLCPKSSKVAKKESSTETPFSRFRRSDRLASRKNVILSDESDSDFVDSDDFVSDVSQSDDDYGEAAKSKKRKNPFRTSKLMFLVGPSGCGKTSAAYAIANLLNKSVLECNPSTKRSGQLLKSLFGEATQSQRLEKEALQVDNFAQLFIPKSVRRGNLILFDEIDNVFDDERGFYGALPSLVESSRIPVLFTCETVPSDFKNLAQHVVNFGEPDAELTLSFCMTLSWAIGLYVPTAVARSVLRTVHFQIRAFMAWLHANAAIVLHLSVETGEALEPELCRWIKNAEADDGCCSAIEVDDFEREITGLVSTDFRRYARLLRVLSSSSDEMMHFAFPFVFPSHASFRRNSNDGQNNIVVCLLKQSMPLVNTANISLVIKPFVDLMAATEHQRYSSSLRSRRFVSVLEYLGIDAATLCTLFSSTNPTSDAVTEKEPVGGSSLLDEDTDD
ncbi:mitochondrial ATPase family AAA domain-containing protein [Andalucia godoyi]|uniref:Mitochondrial ATPase family AAA domain-containing protein n=1 Tax=Andalucia godoyi TaxID=505711 RepID=A0A8K0F4C2_ANDGO|nr:mitochondrial ATPase family AAA domain-containing protein [Andalucia godoyi]|eukprot:ANDGO_01528.mRNA.1 mitochondrial ATPase family AAA domain-containing protein